MGNHRRQTIQLRRTGVLERKQTEIPAMTVKKVHAEEKHAIIGTLLMAFSTEHEMAEGADWTAEMEKKPSSPNTTASADVKDWETTVPEGSRQVQRKGFRRSVFILPQ